MPIHKLCVYCAAAPGNVADYAAGASEVGRLSAAAGVSIIYGGGSVGLMGAVADGALGAGGKVIGVITQQLVDKELAHPRVVAAGNMRVVETMHQRKTIMAGLADSFLALPGGYGTLDELFECLAWAQLGLHHKPVVLLNTRGFFDGILSFLERAGGEGFLRLPAERAVRVAATPAEAMALLHGAAP